jgi:uncharacterized protein YjbI with pentapeptide repeats
MIKYAKTHLQNMDLVLPDNEMNILGPELMVSNCSITIRCAAGSLVIPGARFVDCQVTAKRKLSNFAFDYAGLVNVKFYGRFDGCDFGSWTGVKQAEVRNCDFSEADLRECRFINCDPDTLVFPKWPCFTILQPHSRLQAFLSQSWPTEKLRLVMQSYVSNDPRCSALTGHADILKKYGGDTDTLRTILSRLNGVIL